MLVSVAFDAQKHVFEPSAQPSGSNPRWLKPIVDYGSGIRGSVERIARPCVTKNYSNTRFVVRLTFYLLPLNEKHEPNRGRLTMGYTTRADRGLSTGLSIALLAAVLQGCATTEQTVTLGVGAVTVLGGQAPTHEIQQTYYFGVFDPQDQLPPQMYRIRVHGQASFLSATQFASGWVPAQLIDSLSTSASFDNAGRVDITKENNAQLSDLSEGRRLVLFGPQGFREAPRNHRLVIVMGSSPEEFFTAIDETVGKVSEFIQERRNTNLTKKLFQALVIAKADRERLFELRRDLDIEKELRKQNGESR